MSRTSCIAHPASTPMIITRQEYLAICDGNRCAADLLSVLEFWTNIKLGAASQTAAMNEIKEKGGEKPDEITLWIWKTNEDFRNDLLNVYSEHPVRNALKLLEEKGFVSVRDNPNSKFAFDHTLHYLLNIGNIQAEIDNLERDNDRPAHLRDRVRTSAASSRTSAASSRTSAETIPETTYTEKTKKDILANGFSTVLQVDQPLPNFEVASKESGGAPETAESTKSTDSGVSPIFPKTENAPEKEKPSGGGAKITNIKAILPGTPRPVEQIAKNPRKKPLAVKSEESRFDVWLVELVGCLGKSDMYNPLDSRKAKLAIFGHEMSAVSNMLIAVDRVNEVRSKAGLAPIDHTILKTIKKMATEGNWNDVTAAAYERHLPLVASKMTNAKNSTGVQSQEDALRNMMERAERQRKEDEAFRASRQGKTIADSYGNR